MGDFELNNRLGEYLAHRDDGLLDVAFRRRPIDEGNAHDTHAAPRGSAEPGNTFCLDAPDHLVGSPIVIAVAAEKTHQPLIDGGHPKDLGPRQGADTGGQ